MQVNFAVKSGEGRINTAGTKDIHLRTLCVHVERNPPLAVRRGRHQIIPRNPRYE